MIGDNNCIPSLSEKELLSIRDALEVELLTLNKLSEYETEMDDPQLKSICMDMIKVHKSHYNTLIKHLNC